MNLFQLFRKLDANIPLIIFALDGKEICRAISKEGISTDLYEYDIFSITGIGQVEFYHSKIPTLMITLIK